MRTNKIYSKNLLIKYGPFKKNGAQKCLSFQPHASNRTEKNCNTLFKRQNHNAKSTLRFNK